MKNLLIPVSVIFLSLSLVVSCVQAQEMNQYGAEITADGAMNGKKLTKKLKRADNASLKVEGTITETCPVKGCWMTLDMGNGETMMVKFKDYAFFVPKEGQEGNTAIVEGVAKKEVVDVATLKHYAEDAGKSEEEIAAITKPETRLMFEANGVIIKKSK
jgi:hypothetical protein